MWKILLLVSWTRRKGTTAPASESCSRCRSVSCFCCSAKAAAEACCASHGVERKEEVRHNHQTILQSCSWSYPQFSRNIEWETKRTKQSLASVFNIDTMILVNNLWRSPMSASHLNFRKLLLQHLHLMVSACKTLQNMQAWNHYKKPPPTTWNFNWQTS